VVATTLLERGCNAPTDRERTVRCAGPAKVARATARREEAQSVTDRQSTGDPQIDPDLRAHRDGVEERPATRTDDTPKPSPSREPSAPPRPDDGRRDPLTREGPDAPDAADIEDPDEQL
jgi:hypothetical protein